MRILLVFILATALSFYASDFLAQMWRKIWPRRGWPVVYHHSLTGVILILLGVLSLVLGQPIVGTPNNILVGVAFIGFGIGTVLHHLLAENFIISVNLSSFPNTFNFQKENLPTMWTIVSSGASRKGKILNFPIATLFHHP